MNPWILGRGDKISVPTAIASFPRELVVSPKEWAERFYNVVQWTDMSGGGHFAAAEEPQLLAADLRKFVGTLKN
jgi:pimeloyl-ACP methyl ester carboxylesterase